VYYDPDILYCTNNERAEFRPERRRSWQEQEQVLLVGGGSSRFGDGSIFFFDDEVLRRCSCGCRQDAGRRSLVDVLRRWQQ